MEEIGSKSYGGRPSCDKNWARVKRDLFTPRNQGQCGSCYAHAAAESLRAHAYINSGVDPGQLSVQFIMDCEGRGCSGGWPYRSINFVHSRGGIPTKSDYGAYLGRRGTCKRGARVAVTCQGSRFCRRSEPDIASAICNKGPLFTGIKVNAAFMHYRRGVLSVASCPAGMNNHAVQTIGILQSKGAFLIRNSWGSRWGVDPLTFQPSGSRGFIMLQYGTNTCGLTQGQGYPVGARVAGGHGPSPSHNPCARCESSHLHRGEHCVLASDGTCSTPDDRWYCFSRNPFRSKVSSCDR